MNYGGGSALIGLVVHTPAGQLSNFRMFIENDREVEFAAEGGDPEDITCATDVKSSLGGGQVSPGRGEANPDGLAVGDGSRGGGKGPSVNGILPSHDRNGLRGKASADNGIGDDHCIYSHIVLLAETGGINHIEKIAFSLFAAGIGHNPNIGSDCVQINVARPRSGDQIDCVGEDIPKRRA